MLMNTRYLKILLVFLVSFYALGYLLLPVSPGLVLAQAPTPSDDEVNQIAEQLFCPVCENVPLDECQTAACEQWRDLIRQQLGEGWGEDEIKAFFVAQYGDRVLGEPPRSGVHWLLYVLPWMVFVMGVALLIRTLGRNRGPSSDEDPYLKKVEQDLRHLEHK